MSTPSLLSVEEALSRVLSAARPFATVTCRLDNAAGRVLAEPVSADRDLPPFDRVMMDGIAVSAAHLEQGTRSLPIAFTQAAGQPFQSLENPAACARVMTGAILPGGTDCVIPREQVTLDDRTAHLADNTGFSPGQYIHRQGSDARQGELLLGKGSVLGPAEAMIAAGTGHAAVTVFEPPITAVVSTGDEIVAIDATPLPHQIRSSNSHALQNALAGEGITSVELHHYPDHRETMLEGIRDLLERCGLLIFSGGVSAGDFDYLPGVLEELGVTKEFHKVSQRPGKPFWFGRSAKGTPVFALPGNPVSTLACFVRYIRPFIQTCMSRRPSPELPVVLAQDVHVPAPLTIFLQARLESDGQLLKAVPAEHKGSGDYASLAGTDGFIVLPREQEHFTAGETVVFLPWKSS